MNPLILQIIAVLLILFFIFVLVMCWKSWRITHILFAFFTFAAAATFLVYAAFVVKTQSAWRTLYESHKLAVAQVKAENEKLLHGDMLDSQQGEESLRSLHTALEQLRVDRGRVWDECTLTGAIDGDTFQIRTVPASLQPGETPEPNGIKAGLVVYAFAETTTQDGFKVPSMYLGDYIVDNATDTEVTISALSPLDNRQQNKVNEQGVTWTLYEMMPLDSHLIYAEPDPESGLMVGFTPEQMRQYIQNDIGMDPAEFDKFLETFHRYNRQAAEDEPDENVWVQVRFLKPHKIVVDSDAPLETVETGDFDASGRALVARLRAGSEDGSVEFDIGDTGVFDLETATTLIDQQVCEKIRPLYRRVLNDFTQAFLDAKYRHIQLDDEILTARRDTTKLQTAEALSQQQAAYRQAEKIKLEEELTKFKQEQADATRYAQAMALEHQKMRLRLAQLYARNNELVQQLTRMQLDMAAQINKRSQQPAGTTPPATTPSTTVPATSDSAE